MNQAQSRILVLAGGCFWGVEAIIKTQKGVISTDVGYTGGTSNFPTYQEVCTGTTGHAEAIRITFDPQETNEQTLLELFFRLHDPTTLNRQGHDLGSQYRSAIFVCDQSQRKLAEEALLKAAQSGRWSNEIITKIEDLGTFFPAEDYHQDYLDKNPGGYSCHYLRD